MKKTLSCIGLAIVLSISGSIQTAAAFEQGSRENRAPKETQRSHVGQASREESRSGFRREQGHQEVRFQRPAHYERRLPAGYRTMKIANMLLYYLNGIFYQSTPYGYQMVTAPTGVMVSALPSGYYQIFYGGTTYYVANNTYYVQGPMGYNVVTPPQGIMFPVQTGW